MLYWVINSEMKILRTTVFSMCQIRLWCHSVSFWRRREAESLRATRRSNTAQCTTKAEYFRSLILLLMGTEDDSFFKNCIIFHVSQHCSRGELPVCDLFPIPTNPKVLLGIVMQTYPDNKFYYNNRSFITTVAYIVRQYARIKFLSEYSRVVNVL